MKHQALFSSKDKSKKNIRVLCNNIILLGSLRANSISVISG